MRRMPVAGRTGLRSEIIVNIVLLMGAALLFAGFLLVKLTERELLSQRVNSVTGVMEILTHTIPSSAASQEAYSADLLACATPLLQGLPPGSGVEGWGVAGRELTPLSVSGLVAGFNLEESELVQAKYSAESVVRIHYPSSWWSLTGSFPHSYVVVTVPIFRHGDFIGALQARYSLADVRQRVISAQKLMLFCALFYGTVLVLFGVYFLSRTVVRPIRGLQSMSQRIAAGDLEQAVPVEGPREIADLAASFNAMVEALRQSRQEREAHIQALQQANEEIRQTQDELIRSEKMASVGHLAAGMAHEIGNPLGAVVGYLELLKAEAAGKREKEIVGRALAETERIDRLVRELLDYAAPAGRESQTFDPIGAMVEARDILTYQGAFEGLQLEDRLPPSLPPTAMVRHQLVQVFINLLLNARDASSAGGSIRLCGGEKRGFVWLSVADTGTGMAPEILSHVFDPFFSTKPPGKGRGLGLAICQRVVGEAGGRIEVHSDPGKGSEFTVWLKKTEPAGHED